MLKTAHVGIIGGGIAGLTAAAKLAEKGIQTTLFEASPQLGGRARNVAVEFNSQVVQLDNGQHILLGAYHQTLALFKLIGINKSQAFMRLPLTLETLSSNHHTAFKFSPLSYLPYPINHLFGFLFCKGLSIGERFAVISFILSLKKTAYHLPIDEPLIDYLRRKNQSEKTITLLWEPLCLAALNTPINIASSKIFLNVLKDTFNGKKHDSDFLLPKQGLSALFAQPITHYLNRKSGQILTNHRVKSITATDSGFAVGSKEMTFEFTHIIIATSSAGLKNITSDTPELTRTIKTTSKYQYQPIYTIYLQYSSDTKLTSPMIGLSNMLGQWIFDRGILCGQHGLMAVIISAKGDHQKLSHEALSLKVANELNQAFPTLTKPLWHQVIAEKRATFSCNAGLSRPTSSTRQAKLFLAGDYTYGDYPATIEGAVRSGIKAASMIVI